MANVVAEVQARMDDASSRISNRLIELMADPSLDRASDFVEWDGGKYPTYGSVMKSNG